MLQSFATYPSNQHGPPGDSRIRAATLCPQLTCLYAISPTWQHFHSLQGYIHRHTHGYRYFTHSWATLRTHKAENQEWSPITESTVWFTVSTWPTNISLIFFQSSLQPWFHDNARNSAPQTPPQKKVKPKSFPAEAENSQMLDQTHARKKKPKRFSCPLLGCRGVHSLKMLETITTATPSVKRWASGAAGALSSQHQQKGRKKSRKRGTDPGNPVVPLFSKRGFSSNEGQGWSVLLKISEVGKQEICSRH